MSAPSLNDVISCPHLYGIACSRCVKKRKTCENCGKYVFGFEECNHCGHISTAEACKIRARFLRAFNDMGQEGIIDIASLNESQLKRVNGLLALEGGKKFECVSVQTSSGPIPALYYCDSIAPKSRRDEPQSVQVCDVSALCKHPSRPITSQKE